MPPDYPLAGIRVIELSERGSAAYAGKCLRRLGASVTKVEPLGGDPLRTDRSHRDERGGRVTTAAYDYFNEGKTLVEISDPSVGNHDGPAGPAGPAGLADLVHGADVLVLDIEPNRYAVYGLDPDTMGNLGPRVVGAITPFGLTGPYRDFHGPESVVSAFGGMTVGIGEPGRPPLKMPLMQSAVQGGLVASIAVMGALASPDDVRGAVVDISETDVWATIHAGTTMVSFLFSNRLRRREGRRVVGQPYPHQLFRCSDGYIAMQASERHQWEAFLDMVGNPDWGTDRRFGSRMQMNSEHAEEIDSLLSRWFLARTRAEIFAECRARAIPAAPVTDVAEARDQPSVVARAAVETYVGGTGVALTVPKPPFRFRSADLVAPGAVPTPNGGGHVA